MNSFLSMLCLRAFRPDPLDPAYSLHSRVGHTKSLFALTIGGENVQGYRVKSKGREWKIEKADQADGPFLTPILLDRGRDQVQSSYVTISFTPSNVLCELESGRLPEDPALQKAMLTTPKILLKNRYEQDRRYQVVPSMDHKKYMSFSVPIRDIMVLEKMIKDAGMEIARLQVGIANMTEYAVRRLESMRHDGVKRILLVGDQSIVLSMSMRDGIWEDTLSFISRTSTEHFSQTTGILEYLESLASEVDEPGVEFHLLHSHQCWWAQAAEEWFAQKTGKFLFIKMDPVPAFLEIHLLMEN